MSDEKNTSKKSDPADQSETLPNVPPQQLAVSQSQNKLISQMGTSLQTNVLGLSTTGGQGSFMQLKLNQVQSELRILKKQEQLSKEKLIETEKKLTQEKEEFQKYRTDAEHRLECLRQENSMLNVRIQHMHEQNEQLERSSNQSSQRDNDLLKIIEEYSKSSDLKAKEIEELESKQKLKKEKHALTKKLFQECESQLLRQQAKVDSMTKFCKIFIRHIKTQNLSLHESVIAQQKETKEMFKRCSTELQESLESKVRKIKSQYESLLAQEKQHVETLKQSILAKQEDSQKVLKTVQDDQIQQLESQNQKLKDKNLKLKSKIQTLQVNQSDQDSSFQANIEFSLKHKFELESLQKQCDLQLQERDQLIKTLREQLFISSEKEQTLQLRLDQADTNAKQEYSKLLEKQTEGSSKYSEVRDLYEKRLNDKDQALMQCKEDLIKVQMRLEFTQVEMTRVQAQDERLTQQLQDCQKQLKEKELKLETKQDDFDKQISQLKVDKNNLQTQTQEQQQKISDILLEQSKQLFELKQEHQLKLQEVISTQNEVIAQAKAELKQELDKKSNDLLEQSMTQMQTNHDQQIQELKSQHSKELQEIETTRQACLNFNPDEFERIKMELTDELQECKQKLSANEVQLQQFKVVNEAQLEQLTSVRLDLQEQVSRNEEQTRLIEEIKQGCQTDSNALPILQEKVTLLQQQLNTAEMQLKLKANETITQPIVFDRECQTEPIAYDVAQNTNDELEQENEQNDQDQIMKQSNQSPSTPKRLNIVPKKPPPAFNRNQSGPLPRAPILGKNVKQTAPKQPSPARPQQTLSAFPMPAASEPTNDGQQNQMETADDNPFATASNPFDNADPIEPITQPKPQTLPDLDSPKSEPKQQVQEQPKSQQAPTTPVQKKLPPKPEPLPKKEEEAPSGILGVLGSYFKFMQAKKQASIGKPSTAMYTCKECGHYVFPDDEHVCEDDAPPPPPPKATSSTPATQTPQPLEEEKKEATGAMDLCKPAFSGTMINRNNRSKSKPKIESAKVLPPSFAQTQNFEKVAKSVSFTDEAAANAAELKEQKVQEQVDESMNFGEQSELNQTCYTANDTMSATMMINRLDLQPNQADVETLIRQREVEWSDKNKKLENQVGNLKKQIASLQDALKAEKEQGQSTMDELERFNTQMEQAAKDNQSELLRLKEQIKKDKEKMQLQEMWRWQAEDCAKQYEQDLLTLRSETNRQKQEFFEKELQTQVKEMEMQMQLNDAQHRLQQVINNNTEVNDLSEQNETLRWQLCLANQQQNQAQQKLELVTDQLYNTQRQLQDQKQQLLRQIQEMQSQAEREREFQIRDLLQKQAVDKETWQKEMKRDRNELQTNVKRLEQQLHNQKQEFSRQKEEREMSQQQQLSELHMQKEKEALEQQRVLQKQNDDLQQALRHEQNLVRQQLHQLQTILSQKEEEVQLASARELEQAQELQQMTSMRNKWNDHIIYLQNEIRKRDELLDEDDYDDCEESFINSEAYDHDIDNQDQSQDFQQVQRQLKPRRSFKNPTQVSSKLLDDARLQIKQLLDAKIQLKKEQSSLQQQVRDLTAGLDQISSLISSSLNSNTVSDNEDEDVPSRIISKFFELQNANDAALIEKQHEIDLLKLQQEDQASWKFDLELASQERDMLQQDLQEFAQEHENLKLHLAEVTAKYNQLQSDHNQKLQYAQDQFNQRLTKLQQDSQVSNQESEQIVSKLRQSLQQKEEQIQQITARKKHIQIDLEHNVAQIKDLTQKLQDNNLKYSQQIAEFELELNAIGEERDCLQMELNQVQTTEKNLNDQITDLETSLKEKDEQLISHQQKMTSIASEYDTMAQAFIQKKQQYKSEISALKKQLQEQVEATDSAEIVELKAQLEQADQLIQQMQAETEQIVTQLQEKHKKKELKYKQQLAKLQEEVGASQEAEQTALVEVKITELKEQFQQKQEKLIAEITRLQDENTKCKDQIQKLTSELDENKQQCQQLSEKESQLLEVITNLKQQHAESKETYSAQLENLKTQLNQSAAGASETQEKLLKKLEDELQKAASKILEKENEIEEYKQSSLDLAVEFKKQKKELKEKNSQLKSSMSELLLQSQQLESDNQELNSRLEQIEKKFQQSELDKLHLSQSLDLTKIEDAKNQSSIKLQEQNFEKQFLTIIDLLSKYDSECAQFTEFEQAVEALARMLLDANEDKQTVAKLVQERDENQHEFNGLIYKLQQLSQERDRACQRVKLLEDQNRLAKMVKTLEEERDGYQNDFVIKFNSMSKELNNSREENSKLKSELKKYAPTNPQEQRSFFASLFMNESK